MAAGERDKRLRFERSALVDDGFARTEVWSPYRTVWGSREDLSDGERWRANAVGSAVTARFRVRWSADMSAVTRSDRIICDGITFNIVAIKPIGRRRDLEFTVAAEVD